MSVKGRLAMAIRYSIIDTLTQQAQIEDGYFSELMKETAYDLKKCSSKTIFEVAQGGYIKNCRKDVRQGQDWKKRELPDVKEYVEWRGEGDHTGNMSTIGLAKCKKIQCPLCCYARSFIRQFNALEWARGRDWSEFYGVSLTFTISHTLEDSSNVKAFKNLLGGLKSSLRKFSHLVSDMQKLNAKRYTSPFPDDLGYISSLECTFGKNGLHPHYHVLFFTKALSDVEKLEKWFRRDRVRMWKMRGGSLLRMPKHNEDRAFEMVLEPSEDRQVAHEKVLAYINKSLFETINSAAKDQARNKGKNIFRLSPQELKYFCVFFEATRGLRFYRSGGICKEIPGIAAATKAWEEGTKEDVVNRKLNTLVRIENEKKVFPEMWISEWAKKEQKNLEKQALKLPSDDIKELVHESWKEFVRKKTTELQSLMGITA